MGRRIARGLAPVLLLAAWTACSTVGGPREATQGQDTHWWVVQAQGSEIALLERRLGPPEQASGPWSSRHVLEEGLLELVAPGLTVHSGSVWLGWRDRADLFARPLWWGPVNRRPIPTLGAPTSGPALVSDGERLIAVWTEGDTLFASSSRQGIEWTAPQERQVKGAHPLQPALVLHGGRVFVAFARGRSVMLSRLGRDLSWARPWTLARLGAEPEGGFSLVSAKGRMILEGATAGASFSLQSRWAPGPWSGRRWSASETRPGAGRSDLAVLDARVHRLDQAESGIFLSELSEGEARTGEPERVAQPTEPSVVRLVASPYAFQAPPPEVALLHDSGRPAAETVNLVFLSEGYEAEAMPRYRALVDRVAANFRATNPISKQLDKLNIFRVDQISRERGVDAAPALARAVRQGVLTSTGLQAPVPHFESRATDTAFGAHYRACWSGAHQNMNRSQAQAGPNSPFAPRCDAGEEAENVHESITTQKAIHIFAAQAYEQVEALIPGFDTSRDLLYTIVDQAPEDGATNKASYNPVVTTPDFAEWITNLHEIGHFWTRLADEDMTVCCRPDTGVCACPNLTRNADLDDPDHPWAHHFVRSGRPGDSVVLAPRNRPPDRSEFYDPELVTARDVFNVSLWPTNGNGDWARTKGAIVYAPGHRCLMNHTGAITAFCAVCAETLTRELFEQSGEHFHHDAYHERYEKVFVEYLHRAWPVVDRPKEGLLSVNGENVPLSRFACTVMAPGLNDREVCSVDVTDFAGGLGPDRLVFHADAAEGLLDLLSLQVVNSNGAPLPLHPVTDLSGIGIERYFQSVTWDFAEGDLVFEFDARPLPPPPTLTVETETPAGPVPQ